MSSDLTTSTDNHIFSFHPIALESIKYGRGALSKESTTYSVDLHYSTNTTFTTKKSLNPLPYGEVWFSEGSEDFAPKYNSQELDKESDLYYFNARHYDPELARFVSADVMVDGEDTAFGWNRYMYVHGNPIMYKDPTGHKLVASGKDSSELADQVKKIYGNVEVSKNSKGQIEFELGKGHEQDAGKANYELIRSIIEDERTVTLRSTSRGSYERTTSKDLNDPRQYDETGTDSRIGLNLNSKIKTKVQNRESGEVSTEVIPKHVELAHELNHSLHTIKGVKTEGIGHYNLPDGSVRAASKEEIITTGLEGYTSENIDGIRLEQSLDVPEYNYSENEVRESLGIKTDRVEY